MKHKILIHVCRYEADIIETQAEADAENVGFEPYIDDNGVKHPIYQIGDDVGGWDLVDEQEIVGLQDEYYDEHAADVDFAKVTKGSDEEKDKAWRIAKFGFELIAPWIREQFDTDGDKVQIEEIVREIVDKQVSDAINSRKRSE